MKVPTKLTVATLAGGAMLGASLLGAGTSTAATAASVAPSSSSSSSANEVTSSRRTADPYRYVQHGLTVSVYKNNRLAGTVKATNILKYEDGTLLADINIKARQTFTVNRGAFEWGDRDGRIHENQDGNRKITVSGGHSKTLRLAFNDIQDGKLQWVPRSGSGSRVVATWTHN